MSMESEDRAHDAIRSLMARLVDVVRPEVLSVQYTSFLPAASLAKHDTGQSRPRYLYPSVDSLPTTTIEKHRARHPGGGPSGTGHHCWGK